MGIAPFPTLGEEREHHLIGSDAWERKKRYEANRRPKGHYSLHGLIAQAVRAICIAESEGALRDAITMGTVIDRRVLEGARLHGHEETATGKQLHHQVINYLEVVHALERLEHTSETDYRRYLLAVVGRVTSEALATQEHCAVASVEDSLSRARRHLAARIRDRC